ncbi:tyrosine-type recombinase/integrase [Halorubrum ezzemoulense]|uniref:Tyrosine-type recombinase/integrase n=1 Tax=Halorubrum ezzemoulense TaxID=337243 RepID=A0ABT4Z9R3_HALEZ|nr:tyrosine-type recombinase/integrase [Halorubrum ezzemoulense]MDB2294326.1 tyrosine-type recombinase/integrase [Halorubrum ezzemoulense]
MDVDGIIASYRSRQSTKKAESTAYDYARIAREWAEWLGNPGTKDYDTNNRNRDAKQVWEATAGDIRTFLRQQLDSGISGNTVQNRRWSLSTFYKELDEMSQEEGFNVPNFENPADNLDTSDWNALKNGSKKKQELKEVYYLDPSEIDELAENASNPKLRNELIIRLLYQTGLRRGELAETRLEDVDTNERAIKVHATKTHLNRTVYYQPSLDTLLNRWVNVERKSLVTAGSEYLFPTFKTDQITPKQINRTVRKAADNAGLQSQVFKNAEGHNHMKVTAHVLRHSFAVQSIKNGMDTRTLQKLLGHAKIETTERYLRLAKSDVRDAARKYGAGTE